MITHVCFVEFYYAVMDEFTPYLSPRDLSNSGYLNDALLEFTTDEHSKRRRLLPCVDHEPASNKSPSIDIGFEEVYILVHYQFEIILISCFFLKTRTDICIYT